MPNDKPHPIGQYILMVSCHLICLANYKLLLNFNFNMRNASLYLLMDLWETFLINAEDKLEGECPRSGEPDSYRKKNVSYPHYIRNSMRTSLIVLKNESVQWCCYELKNSTMKFSGTELHELMYWSLDCYIIPVSSTNSLTTQQHRVDKMSDSLLCLLTSWWAGLLSQWISLK